MEDVFAVLYKEFIFCVVFSHEEMYMVGSADLLCLIWLSLDNSLDFGRINHESMWYPVANCVPPWCIYSVV